MWRGLVFQISEPQKQVVKTKEVIKMPKFLKAPSFQDTLIFSTKVVNERNLLTELLIVRCQILKFKAGESDAQARKKVQPISECILKMCKWSELITVLQSFSLV